MIKKPIKLFYILKGFIKRTNDQWDHAQWQNLLKEIRSNQIQVNEQELGRILEKEKESFLPSSASSVSNPAITLSRHNIPENWRFVLVIPNVKKGAYGDEEISVFQNYAPIPQREVNEVSHQIIMKIIPGIIKNDLKCFGDGLKRIQSIGFKKIEINLQHNF